MEETKKDKIILDAGYDVAINEVLENLKDLKDLPYFEIISDRLERMKWKRRAGEYEAILTKHYVKDDDVGYIIIDDVNKIRGVMIILSTKEKVELSEYDAIFVKKNIPKVFERKFDLDNSYKIEEYIK